MQASQDEQKMEEELAAMASEKPGAERHAQQDAEDADEAMREAEENSRARIEAAKQEGSSDLMSQQLESAAAKQEQANKAAAVMLDAEVSAQDAQMQLAGSESKDSLLAMANVAGIAQNAEDRLVSSGGAVTSSGVDVKALEHQAAADAAKKVKDGVQGDMAKMMAEMAEYKKEMAQVQKSTGIAPVQDTAALAGLRNKMAQMEGEVKVVREEEKSSRGNAAQTAQLLAKERQLVQEESAAKTQIAAAQATAAAASATNQQPPVAAGAAVVGMSPAVQTALVKRVGSLEKALLAIKNLNTVGANQAAGAENEALQARIQLLERKIQDMSSQKQTESFDGAVADDTGSEIAKLRSELTSDAKITQQATQGAAAAEKAQYSSLTLAKKKAVMLRTRQQLEAKLERLNRQQEMTKAKVSNRLEANKAKQQLQFERKAAELSELNDEAQRAEQLSIERAEEQMERKQDADKQKADADEEELREEMATAKAQLMKADMKAQSAAKMKEKQKEMVAKAEADLSSQMGGMKQKLKADRAEQQKLQGAVKAADSQEKDAEAKEEAAAANDAEAEHSVRAAEEEQKQISAKLRAGLFKENQIAALAETEKQKAAEIKSEIAAAKKQLAAKEELEAKLESTQTNLAQKMRQQQQEADALQDLKAKDEMHEKVKQDELKDMKAVIDDTKAKQLELNKAAASQQKQIEKEQDVETARLKRGLDEELSKLKEELNDQRSSNDVRTKQLQDRLREIQKDAQASQVAQSTAMASVSEADIKETEQEVADAQKIQDAKAAAMREKVKLEEQKSAGVTGKAEQLLRQGKATARAALEDAQAAAKTAVHETKLENADKIHKAEQYYAQQVATLQEREHSAKEQDATQKHAAAQAAHEADASAQTNTQKVLAQIAQRSKDDIKNAFIQAHKDKHSALAEAVAKQQDSEEKLKAATESLDKAIAESEDARSRARHKSQTASAAIDRHTELSSTATSDLGGLKKQAHEVELELSHVEKELAEQQDKAKAAASEKTDVAAKLEAAEVENHKLHADVRSASDKKREIEEQRDELVIAVDHLRATIAEKKTALRAVQKRKAEEVMAAAKADQQRTQAELDNSKSKLDLLKAKKELAIEQEKKEGSDSKKEGVQAKAAMKAIRKAIKK
jgi:hypothetical protein